MAWVTLSNCHQFLGGGRPHVGHIFMGQIVTQKKVGSNCHHF